MRLQDALGPTAAARHPGLGVRVERWQYPGRAPQHTIHDRSGRRWRGIEELPDRGWECCHACEHGRLDYFHREGNKLIFGDGAEVEFSDEVGVIQEIWRLERLGYCYENRPPVNLREQWWGR